MVDAILRGDYDLSVHTFCDASGVYVVISTIQVIQSRLLTAKYSLVLLRPFCPIAHLYFVKIKR